MIYLFFIIVLLLAIVGPGIWVGRVMQKYSEPADRYPRTGADVARYLLNELGLQSVLVEATDKGDHYDPQQKRVRLSADNHDGSSLTAITVAAHEVGHAVQDSRGYPPLKWRTRMLRSTRVIEKLGAGVLIVSPFLGILTRAPILSLLTFAAGFVTLGTAAIVHMVTLPTEFDASFNRALPLLEKHGILKAPDKPYAAKILRAAALTYVSASLMSLVNIARWIAILRR